MWIRSQDKLRLFINPKLNIQNFYYDEFSIVDISDNSDYILGIYKSKERAIEVLDEIQKAILGYIPVIDRDRYTGIATISTTTKQIVYEMPEE